MTETKLLPCPFCGGEAFLASGEEFGETYTEVSCTLCNATVSKLGAEAIEAWNTRAERTCRNVSNVGQFVCSKCEAWIDIACMWQGDTSRTDSSFVKDCALNYCPNCGAKAVDE